MPKEIWLLIKYNKDVIMAYASESFAVEKMNEYNAKHPHKPFHAESCLLWSHKDIKEIKKLRTTPKKIKEK